MFKHTNIWLKDKLVRIFLICGKQAPEISELDLQAVIGELQI